MSKTQKTYQAAQIPDQLLSDAAAEATWKARFRSARISTPEWAEDAPHANVYASNASGEWQIYAWDRNTDEHRQVTDRSYGTIHAMPTPDGKSIWWFNDTNGDELGVWVTEPFTANPTVTPQPAIADVPKGYSAGVALRGKTAAVGVAQDSGSQLFLHQNGKTVRFYHHIEDAEIGALSRDETLVAISHSEHGDSRHPALRVLSTKDFSTVAEKWDGEGKGLHPLDFSPVPGDSRLLVIHERRGTEQLLLWNLADDTEIELDIDLPGEIAADWYPNADALLVVHNYQARSSLYRYDLTTKELSSLDIPKGKVGGAGVRPDGVVEYSWSSSEHPPSIRRRLLDGTDDVLLTPPGDRAPRSVRITDAFVDGPGGPIHVLIGRPENAPEGPLPTAFLLHGGPHYADQDYFSGYKALWLDAGFAIVMINYRGSTGYGSAWRDAIEGRPGLTELEDVAAVHDWAVASGLAKPDQCVAAGASWGGYLTLLALGIQPERWAVGVASIPVADYVAAYDDEIEQIRAFDRALFGGSPKEIPTVYKECSPITYVDAVQAPVLILAADNDARCPIRQVENYLERLADRQATYEFYRYDAGHDSLVVAEVIKQSMAEVDFALRSLKMK